MILLFKPHFGREGPGGPQFSVEVGRFGPQMVREWTNDVFNVDLNQFGPFWSRLERRFWGEFWLFLAIWGHLGPFRDRKFL